MGGRKPIPTSLRILRGNPSRRKLNKKEPRPVAGIPEFPPWLDALGDPTLRPIWDELAGLLTKTHVLTSSDGEALSMLVHRLWQYRTAAMALKDGTTYTTTTETGDVMYRSKPEVALSNDLSRQIRALLSDFGMTPSSRTKISTTGEDDPMDCIEDFLYGVKK